MVFLLDVKGQIKIAISLITRIIRLQYCQLRGIIIQFITKCNYERNNLVIAINSVKYTIKKVIF